MITFILIFFISIIAVGALSVLGFALYLKRRKKSLETTNPKQFDEPPQYRSLFAPTDEETRAFEREEKAKIEAERQASEQKAALEQAENVRRHEEIWRSEPTTQNAAELFRLAVESGSAEIFSQTAENVIQVWRNGQAGDLSKENLADLLDSHLRTLPQQERLSGAIFWIKREIENLRRESESKF